MKEAFETNFIQQAKEKTPFKDIPAQKFFAQWCEINDSIVPQFMAREEWEQRGVQGILEKNNQGKQTLFLPEDLHLWEMMDVIKTVDNDTLARSPEKRAERADKIKELGKTFEKAGLYLSEYLPISEKGKQIAKDVAREFYQYGLSLQNKEQRGDEPPQEISLSPQDKARLDEWFLGRDVYQKRMARLGENPMEEQINAMRKKLIRVYFEALAREGYKNNGEKPWETKVGPIQHLQDRTKRQITREIETPEREMKTAIFRRGLEKLVTEMKERNGKNAINNLFKKLGFNPLLEQRKLYDVLQIPTLKANLEEIRKTGDVTKISAMELKIAKEIQKAVSSFPYKTAGGLSASDHPAKMVETQYINCVGSSILGGGLLDELGIKYLHASLPRHSATVLITSDDKAYWQDFTPGRLKANFTEITPDMIEEQTSIPVFAKRPNDSGISVTFKDWNPYRRINGQLSVDFFNPEIGLQGHILNNTGNALNRLGREEEAIEAYKQAIDVNPKDTYPYNGLGNALSSLGREEEAIEAYKQAIDVNPKYDYPYNGLGSALSSLGKKKEAIEAYRQAINVNPKSDYTYNGLGNALSSLGKKKEAIEAYREFISLWKGNQYWIKRAQKRIKELEKE